LPDLTCAADQTGSAETALEEEPPSARISPWRCSGGSYPAWFDAYGRRPRNPRSLRFLFVLTPSRRSGSPIW